MTKEELLQEFNRISNDPRQAQMFVKHVIEEIGNINIEELPYIEDLDNLTIEDVNKIKCKCFNWNSIICYPIYITDGVLYYVGIADDTYLYYFTINYTEESNIVLQYSVQYPLADLKEIIPNVGLPENPTELTSLEIGDTTYKVFNPDDTGVINLGQLYYDYDAELGRNDAGFHVQLTDEQFAAIPNNGLCMLMFNTTCVCVPYVKGQYCRFICNAVVDDIGNSITARGRMNIQSDEYSKNLFIDFDENYADQLMQTGFTTKPYGVIRFLGI